VPDQDTADLMNEFFRQLAAGKDKPEALRLAQMSVLHSLRMRGKSDPSLWGAFVISGRPD
jgi:CHAT domain-containing protein